MSNEIVEKLKCIDDVLIQQEEKLKECNESEEIEVIVEDATLKLSNNDEFLQKTPEKRKSTEESPIVPEKQHKIDEELLAKTPVPENQHMSDDDELLVKTPERKSIIEIRISNEINTQEPLCEPSTPTRIEHKIIDLEKLQGGIITSPSKDKNEENSKILAMDVESVDSEPTVTVPPPETQETPISTENMLVTEIQNLVPIIEQAEENTEKQIMLASPEEVIDIPIDSIIVDKTDNLDEIIIPIKPENPNEIIQTLETSKVINQEERVIIDIKPEEEQKDQTPVIQLTEAEKALDQQHRESCMPFLQHVPCLKLQTSDTAANDEKVPRCRECCRKDFISQSNDTDVSSGNDVYCRFSEFRRLQYTADGELCVAGFPNPYQDPKQEDINIWEPDESTEPTAGYMDVQVCRFILLHVGDQFCYLWQQELEAFKIHENPDDKIAWKKLVKDIREICDVCDTTLFNYHWTCKKCGFGVCIDCFKDRKEKRIRQKLSAKSRRGRDEFHWLLCTNTENHQLPELMLTQIITGNSLHVLCKLLHEVRMIWQIPQKCDCPFNYQVLPEGPTQDKLNEIIGDMINESRLNQQTASSSLATKETLRHQRRMEKLHKHKLDFARSLGIDYVPGRILTKETLDKDPITTAFDSYEHINFLRKGMAGYRRFLPPKVMTMCSSTLLAPNVRHEWLCDGKLLRLTDPLHPDNRILFQEVWKCGQPVMVSEVARSLNLDLWRPEAFCRDFGDIPNDLINCLNGNLVPNQPMRHFWEGFQCIKKRLVDASGTPMLLKLKDWPPGDDFAEILPTRYADLMKGLPLPEYTLRTGNLNIASCLPKMFVPPDLGPKMYNAYGSALHPDKGTTNLHLDISDAVNVMVYVGIPQDAESKSQLAAAQHAIAMGGCDFLTRLRCQSSKVMPGALWHIFAARDADKIRDLLNRVTLEKGFRLEPDHDPIHDQNWYLDDELRARLFREYRVKGYPIVQCLGDAVFIPAGAPHQVQNLHNCIKVAEDFVSPENITHCYHLTHEFRQLSNSHTNHEDKLQIKNIIFHAVKDCCTILTRALEKRSLAELTEAKRKRKLKKEQAKAKVEHHI